jgi:hypothetical protein
LIHAIVDQRGSRYRMGSANNDGGTMIALRALLCWTLLTVASAGLSAASYYATQSGAGSKNGTSVANAWSVAGFNASSAPTGGDTVYFSGTITSTVTPGSNGTGNGASRLTLDFSAATLTDPAISLSNNSYLTLLGGSVVEGSDGNTIIKCAYVSPGAGHDITISNFTFTGISGGSTTFFSVGSCTNVLISNNTLDNILSFVNEWQGKTHDITILNNSARTSQNVTQQSDVISMGDTINATIRGNKLINQSPGSQSNSRHNDIIQTFQSGASQNQIPSNWTIAYNWIEEDVTSCADTDGSNSWTMIENTGGSNYLYGNVFYAPGPCQFGNGETLDSSQSSVIWYVYNNTYISPNGYPGIWFQNSGHLYFRNNVFQLGNASGTYLEFYWTAGAAWDYNYFYGVPDCNSTVSGPHGSCSKNPLFSDYAAGVVSLQSSSPLISAGDSTIGSQFNQGIAAGATWPNPPLVTRGTNSWSVGAYQYGGSQTTGQPPNPPTSLALVVQ